MLPAEFIGYRPNFSVVALGVAVVLFSILDRHRVPHDVVVNMPGIQMGADYRLILPLEELPGKFQPDLVCQFGGHFTSRKTLHQMKALHPAGLVPHLLDFAHIFKGGFAGAGNGRLKQVLFCLGPVESIDFLGL